jgi:hypothetical protein
MRRSQIQALDREQPVLPMMPGVPERRTHSYVRHGTTTLFAALDVASGFIIGKCYKRHRAIEFLKFLKEIDAKVPEGLDVHIVMDNYAIHKTPKIKTWLARRPHYHVHFTPTPPHGSIRSSAGSLNSPENKSSEAFTLPSGSSRPTSVPSSTCTTKTQSPSNGPSPLTRFWLQSNASVTKLRKLYVANFRFT